MELLIREYVKRDGRGKRRKFQEIATFDYPGIFDTLYCPAKHRHFVLHELRCRTGPAPAFLGRNKKKSERLSKYERPSRKTLTFFLEGLMSNFPLGYLRTFCPRKSKPCSTCVMTVFAGESSSPRFCRNCSTRGLISPSSSSLVLPVMTKSSA